MQNRSVAAVVVGVAGGLIIGYFVGLYQGRQAAPGLPQAMLAGQTGPDGASGMPENHPGPEVIERVATLREQAQKDPKDKDSRIQLGNLFYDLGQYEPAIEWYTAALELDPKNVNVRTDMGTAYHFLGKHDRALQEFAVSLSLEPTHPQTLQNLGWVRYEGMKDYKGALDAWGKLLQLHPEYQNADQIRKQMDQVKAEMAGGKG